MNFDPQDHRGEFNARRTDIASGNRSIGFNLDDRFGASSGYLLKVTFADTTRTRWTVEYSTHESPLTVAPIVETIGEGGTVPLARRTPDRFASSWPRLLHRRHGPQ